MTPLTRLDSKGLPKSLTTIKEDHQVQTDKRYTGTFCVLEEIIWDNSIANQEFLLDRGALDQYARNSLEYRQFANPIYTIFYGNLLNLATGNLLYSYILLIQLFYMFYCIENHAEWLNISRIRGYEHFSSVYGRDHWCLMWSMIFLIEFWWARLRVCITRSTLLCC